MLKAMLGMRCRLESKNVSGVPVPLSDPTTTCSGSIPLLQDNSLDVEAHSKATDKAQVHQTALDISFASPS